MKFNVRKKVVRIRKTTFYRYYVRLSNNEAEVLTENKGNKTATMKSLKLSIVVYTNGKYSIEISACNNFRTMKVIAVLYLNLYEQKVFLK
ncbi:hypothetical protein KHA80_02645 [Anaerobacillus sp. HL2]|nr:hypothetical protein KHA80_02645 [Anaerobacillus sp. HL2]